jgi:hypothetical protein
MRSTGIKKTILVISLVLSCAYGIANAATTSIGASGQITAALSGSVTQIDFGKFTNSGGSGTVALTYGGACNATPGGAVALTGGTPTCGAVAITGQTGASVSLSLTGATATLGDGSAHTMDAALTFSGGGTTATCTVDTDCNSKIVVASLTVGDSTANPAGTYSTATGGTPGTLTITYS